MEKHQFLQWKLNPSFKCGIDGWAWYQLLSCLCWFLPRVVGVCELYHVVQLASLALHATRVGAFGVWSTIPLWFIWSFFFLTVLSILNSQHLHERFGVGDREIQWKSSSDGGDHRVCLPALTTSDAMCPPAARTKSREAFEHLCPI